MTDALPGGFDSSFGGLSQQQLELGEELLDWVQVRTVWRQEQELGAGGSDGLAHRSAFVAAQVVHDDDVPWLEGWHQELLDISGEGLAVDRAVEDAGCIDPIMPQRCQEGERAPVPKGGPANQLFAARSPTADRGHVGLGPRLVDEDEAPWIKPALILSPLLAPFGDGRPQLLGGEQSFF